jgi:hypothetical protein
MGEQFFLDDRVAYRGYCHDQALELQVGRIHESSNEKRGI